MIAAPGMPNTVLTPPAHHCGCGIDRSHAGHGLSPRLECMRICWVENRGLRSGLELQPGSFLSILKVLNRARHLTAFAYPQQSGMGIDNAFIAERRPAPGRANDARRPCAQAPMQPRAPTEWTAIPRSAASCWWPTKGSFAAAAVVENVTPVVMGRARCARAAGGREAHASLHARPHPHRPGRAVRRPEPPVAARLRRGEPASARSARSTVTVPPSGVGAGGLQAASWVGLHARLQGPAPGAEGVVQLHRQRRRPGPRGLRHGDPHRRRHRSELRRRAPVPQPAGGVRVRRLFRARIASRGCQRISPRTTASPSTLAGRAAAQLASVRDGALRRSCRRRPRLQ